MSARSASSMRRGSATISVAPRSWARLIGRAEHRVGLGRVGAGDEDHVARPPRPRASSPTPPRCSGPAASPPPTWSGTAGCSGRRCWCRWPPRNIRMQQVVLFVGALGRREARQGVGPPFALDAHQLLGGETPALPPRSPRGTARTTTPAWRRGRGRPCRSVPAAAARRTDFPVLRGGRAGLVCWPSPSIVRQGPARRSAPPGPRQHPATPLLLPSPADERPGEPVAVLGEVVAEPPLHAGAALVRRVDPRCRGR